MFTLGHVSVFFTLGELENMCNLWAFHTRPINYYIYVNDELMYMTDLNRFFIVSHTIMKQFVRVYCGNQEVN